MLLRKLAEKRSDGVGTRRPNPKLAKIHRTYTVDDAAKSQGVHRNTVRAWIKRGLPTIDAQRPVLIHGQDLAHFLRAQRLAKKRPCQPGEIYCMRCREPRQPCRQQALYQPQTPTHGSLIGLCPVCSKRMFRRTSFSALLQAAGGLQITLANDAPHIAESPQPIANSDFNQEP